jgi:large subunit ribosomal protein L6
VSRIGKKPIKIPGGVKVSQSKSDAGTKLAVEGPKGKLAFEFRPEVSFSIEGEEVSVTRHGEEKFARSYYGTARALAANMIHGVSQGFEKTLEIEGVGYSAKLGGKQVVLQIGFCHPVEMVIPTGLEVETPNATTITIRGADRQLVGEFAAKIRRIRPPEPYKGKGIRYRGEHIVRKAGKTFGSGD